MTDVDPPRRLLSSPAGVTLGPLGMIAAGKARNFVLRIGTQHFHGFLVRQGEAVHGYVDRCPHAGLPLAQQRDGYMTPDGALIACSWHGALFRVLDGACIAGPCVGQRLTPWLVTVRDGALVTTAKTVP